MTLEQFLTDYGYLALLVGCFLEGETILILGGFAALRGYLDLRLVMLAAFAGSVLGDQLFFFLGRRYGARWLRRRPSWQEAALEVERRLGRHRDLFIFGFRFLYGLRTVSPFVIAMGRVPLPRFAVLNVLGAATWAIVFGGLGYLFGQSVQLLIGQVQHYERYVFLGLAVVGLVIFLSIAWRRRRRRRARRTAAAPAHE